MKQSFNHSVIQLLNYSVIFFSSCRSIPPEQHLRANVRTEETATVNRSERVQTTWNESTLETFLLKTDEAVTVETVIIRYDTSLPVDSVTGRHPIKEIVQSSTVKRRESALSDGIEQEKKGEQLSETDTQLRQETTQAESVDQLTKGHTSSLWRYFAAIVGIVVLLFGIRTFIRYN